MTREEALRGQEVGMDVRRETLDLLKKKGPKLDKVLLRLRQSLNAKETKVIKLKGAITKNDLPKGFDLIVNTGTTIQNDTCVSFGDGNSLIKYDVVAHGHRLKAVDLALQLHDAMPSKKHEHSGSIDMESGVLNAIIAGLPPEFAEGVCSELSKYISDQRNRSGAPKKN